MNEITTNKTDTNLILQKLESTLPAVQKQISELCVSKDAHTTISDLQYSGQTPLIWVQQCALQQQQRLDALRETWFRHKKNEIRIKKWRDKGDELSMLKADEVEAGLNASKNVIRNAMEELQHYQDQINALKDFARTMVNHCSSLRLHIEEYEAHFEEFQKYRFSVPVMGCILLNSSVRTVHSVVSEHKN